MIDSYYISTDYSKAKAYIPLRRKKSCVGPWHWLSPPTPLFCVGDTNMLVSEKTLKNKICILPTPKNKICVSPDAKPQRQPVEYRLRWVPGVGSLHWACTFHIFVLISFASGTQRELVFQWNMGLRINQTVHIIVKTPTVSPFLNVLIFQNRE